jgi:hypothetical protein
MGWSAVQAIKCYNAINHCNNIFITKSLIEGWDENKRFETRLKSKLNWKWI